MLLLLLVNKANLMQVNGWMSFLDLSRGVESRTWTFPEGVAINLDSTEVTTSAIRKPES